MPKFNSRDQIMYRSWNEQLGWSDTLYAEPPMYADPWPGTIIFECRVEVIKEAPLSDD